MRLKAETIIETVVASLILSISVFFSIGIVNKLLFSSRLKQQAMAVEMVNEEIFKSVTEKETKNELKQNDQLILKKTVSDYDNNLKMLQVDVFTKDTVVILSTRRLINIDEED